MIILTMTFILFINSYFKRQKEKRIKQLLETIQWNQGTNPINKPCHATIEFEQVNYKVWYIHDTNTVTLVINEPNKEKWSALNKKESNIFISFLKKRDITLN